MTDPLDPKIKKQLVDVLLNIETRLMLGYDMNYATAKMAVGEILHDLAKTTMAEAFKIKGSADGQVTARRPDGPAN